MIIIDDYKLSWIIIDYELCVIIVDYRSQINGYLELLLNNYWLPLFFIGSNWLSWIIMHYHIIIMIFIDFLKKCIGSLLESSYLHWNLQIRARTQRNQVHKELFWSKNRFFKNRQRFFLKPDLKVFEITWIRLQSPTSVEISRNRFRSHSKCFEIARSRFQNLSKSLGIVFNHRIFSKYLAKSIEIFRKR